MRALRDRAFWSFMGLALLTFLFVARATYDGVRNARTLRWIQAEMEKAKRQIATVKDQNAWSIEDRANLHDALEEIRGKVARIQ